MRAISRLFALGAIALGTVAASQVQAGQVRATTAPTRSAPTAAALATQAAPNPGGLPAPFPAGVTSGSGAAVSIDPIASSTRTAPVIGSNGVLQSATTAASSNVLTAGTIPGTTAGSRTIVGGTGVVQNGATVVPSSMTEAQMQAAAAATTTLGAGATVRGPGQSVGGAGGFSAMDEARSFFFADANHDGSLTRAEAGRLSISTMSFEEMDRNFDGVISRFEYEDSLR